MYIALRRLKVGDAYVNAGEPVPGAENWPSLRALIGNGSLEWRNEAEEEKESLERPERESGASEPATIKPKAKPAKKARKQ